MFYNKRQQYVYTVHFTETCLLRSDAAHIVRYIVGRQWVLVRIAFCPIALFYLTWIELSSFT